MQTIKSRNIKDFFLSGAEVELVAPEVSDCHVDLIRCQNTTTRGDGMDHPERDLKGGAEQNSPLALIGNGQLLGFVREATFQEIAEL